MVAGRLLIQYGFSTVNKTSLTSISWGGRGGLGCLIHLQNRFILPCVPKKQSKNKCLKAKLYDNLYTVP